MLAIISSRYQYGPFLFFVVAEVMSNYLTTDGLKKIFLLPEAPLRPEVRGICHICHMVNPALTDTSGIAKARNRGTVHGWMRGTVATNFYGETIATTPRPLDLTVPLRDWAAFALYRFVN